MPSPIGHALGSLIVGAPARRGWLILALVGITPDLDLLWGRHSMETHSVGAALLAGLATFVLARTLEVRTNTGGSYEPSTFVRTLGVRTNIGAAVLVASVWLAHPLMDALGADDSLPRGVMLLWPFSREFFIAPVAVFEAVSRMYWRDDFVRHNVAAITKEILVLAPLVGLSWLWRRRRQ